MSGYLIAAAIPSVLAVLTALWAMSRPTCGGCTVERDGDKIIVRHDAGSSVYWAVDGTRAKDRRPS